MSIRDQLAQTPSLRDTSCWPAPESSDVTEGDVYLRRKLAMEMYMQGYTLAEIEDKTNLSKVEIYRYLKRCLTDLPGGDILGFRGIVPRAIVKPYQREAPIDGCVEGARPGLAGAFMKLMSDHPPLHAFVARQSKKMRGMSPKAIAKAIHNSFLKRCSKYCQPWQYPFNTVRRARTPLIRYIDRYLKEFWSSYAGDDTFVVRTGQPRAVGRLRPYEEAECDGHMPDWYIVIKMQDVQPSEWIYSDPLKIFLVLILDRRSRNILGYSYELGSTNYPGITVAKAIASMLRPWHPKDLTFEGLTYKSGAGLPNGAVDGCEAVLIDALYMDNAMANRCSLVANAITAAFSATLNFGRAGEPTARSILERVNRTLQDRGFRLLPGSFYANATEKERKRASEEAKEHAITQEELEQIIDTIIANYNVMAHGSLHGLSPSKYLHNYLLADAAIVRRSPDPEKLISSIMRMEFYKRIRGGGVSHRTPYVEWEGARYRNDSLRSMTAWIGKRIRIVVQIEDDVRFVRAYASDGIGEFDVGLLHALPPWHETPHTLKERRDTRAICKKRKIFVGPGQDLIQVVRHNRAMAARTSPSAGRDLARMGSAGTRKEGTIVSKPIRSVVRVRLR